MLDELPEILVNFGTACVSDAMDVLGLDGGCREIRSLVAATRCCGPAYTVKFEPVDAGAPAPAADYIDDAAQGAVIVLDNGGRDFCTVWGDLLSLAATRRGVAGTIIDGFCRDLGGIAEMGYPMFARGAFMKSGKNRVRMSARQIPVEIGGATVRPGDWILADESGALCLPAERLEEIASIAEGIHEMELKVRGDIESGMALNEARARHGYNRFAFRSGHA